jgi:hypothetical protein
MLRHTFSRSSSYLSRCFPICVRSVSDKELESLANILKNPAIAKLAQQIQALNDKETMQKMIADPSLMNLANEALLDPSVKAEMDKLMKNEELIKEMTAKMKAVFKDKDNK